MRQNRLLLYAASQQSRERVNKIGAGLSEAISAASYKECD